MQRALQDRDVDADVIRRGDGGPHASSQIGSHPVKMWVQFRLSSEQ